MCKESEHYVDEPEYCAEFKKRWFKEHKEKPLWLPTKSMADTGLEEFDYVGEDGLRYLHHEYYVPVGCSNIEHDDQPPRESCPFARDDVAREKICQHILKRRRDKEAEKAEKKNKAMMKFSYFN